MDSFKDMLGSGESLFLNEPLSLEYDYLPKKVLYREAQQTQISLCIKPLLDGRSGRNIFIYGAP
ncbi:MAG: hypothetical protein NT001_03335, partial [Candidatus Woesearchaeota archaeon]|nr:hypothetical protein [Candidatus Woesearchaeota archaeon]